MMTRATRSARKPITRLTEFAHTVPCQPSSPSALRRSRSSLPVLKKGRNFSSTLTVAPVRGLRPTRALRRRTENEPKSAQLNAITVRQRSRDLIEHRVDDTLDIALIEMRITLRQAGDQFRLCHIGNPGEGAVIGSNEPELAP